MEIAALCAVIASMRVVPNRSQFFPYESVSLSCGERENWSEWTLRRNTTRRIINEECVGKTEQFHCSIDTVYPSDTGVYWCESRAGDCRAAVNITVSRGPVILENPALPVMEGHSVTLRCRARGTSNLTAEFYKDGRFIGSSSTGDLSIRRASKSDEGLYRCNVSGAGQSPDGWLSVTEAAHPQPSHVPLAYILLPVAGVCLFMVTMVLFCLWKSNKGESDPADVSYMDVTITQDVMSEKVRGLDSSGIFYSTLNLPGAT